MTDQLPSAPNGFADFGLAPAIFKAIAAAGYERPTPIQTQAIPIVMSGRDLLGIAQTGTGKTAAFALPILHRLARDPYRPGRASVRVLVLSPTRELAAQIAQSFKDYAGGLKLSIATVFGGVPIPRQIKTLAGGVDVLVATPGRLIDLLDRRAVSLASVDVLVLDEADQMMDMGFIHALREIAPLLPPERQTLMFSATMPKPIAALAADFLTDPLQIAVAPVATTAERVEQALIEIAPGDKPSLLAHVLKTEAIDRALVFSRTKHGADRIVRQLDGFGIESVAIHGNKSQPQRLRVLDAFRSGACQVMIATDIAARGIDIDGVSHVINYDIPEVPEQYVHRIGRTARAGRSGVAISFATREDRDLVRGIERTTRLKIPVVTLPDFVASPAPAAPVERDWQPERAENPRGRRREEPRAERAPAQKPVRNGAGEGRGAPRDGTRYDQRTDTRNETRGEIRGPARGPARSEPRSEQRPDQRGEHRSANRSERGPAPNAPRAPARKGPGFAQGARRHADRAPQKRGG